MPKVLVQGAIAARRAPMLAEMLGPDWQVVSWHPGQDAKDAFSPLATDADVIVGGGIPVAWPEVGKLKLFQIPWTGFDFTAPEKMPKGVPVANTFEHETCIAEFVLLAMLEWEIGLRHLDSDIRKNGWGGFGPGLAPSHGEVKGKTLGIVGYGHIGHETAMRAKAFGMRCIGIRRSAQPCTPELDWLGQTDRLDELLAESDFVLIACDMNEETIGMMNAERLARMKPTGVIINVARGKIIEEDALFDALESRRIGGAVIDTWYNYGDGTWPSNRPFQELDNVILSPHRSAVTEEMHARRWRFVADQCERVARGQPPENVVFHGVGPSG
ncbi:MAG: 2-hydroxyacid dehydrogenase [Pseudomonadota bacterium]